MTQTRVRNDLFDNKLGHDRGATVFVFAAWYLVKCFFFLSPLPWPSRVRVWWLRLFGGRVGRDVYLKPRVNIHYPWKISIGDYTWVGEEVCIINFESVDIGKHCCLSQRATVCAGNHDYRDPAMRYRNAPITLADGCWIACGAFVGPGITVGVDAMVSAGSILNANVADRVIVQGNPAKPIGYRYKDLG